MLIHTRGLARKKQPQWPARIEKSNPLTKGLVDVVLPLGLTNKTIIRGYTPSVSAGTVLSAVGPLGRNIKLEAVTFDSGLIIAADGDDLFPSTTDATIFVIRRSLDTTARASTIFAYENGAGERVLCHGPWSDGSLYFDFGGTAADQRISVAFTKSTTVDYLVFVAGGGKGREVWRNGIKIAGDTTKTGSRTTTTVSFKIGGYSGVSPDNEEVYLFGVADRAWSDPEIESWFDNPWQIFESYTRKIYVVAAGGVTLDPQPAIATSAALTPTLTPGAVTLSPAQAISTSVAVTPTLTPGVATLNPNAAVSTSVAVTPVLTGPSTLSPDPAVATSVAVTPALLAPSTKLGGDDVPRRKSPHKGWDKAAFKKKKQLEESILKDLELTYKRVLYGEEEVPELPQEPVLEPELDQPIPYSPQIQQSYQLPDLLEMARKMEEEELLLLL